jgi:hypothetical protein
MHKCDVQVKENLQRCRFSWKSSAFDTIYCSKNVKCGECGKALNFRNRCKLPCIYFKKKRWYHLELFTILNSKDCSLE